MSLNVTFLGLFEAKAGSLSVFVSFCQFFCAKSSKSRLGWLRPGLTIVRRGEQAGVAGRRHKVCHLSLPMEKMLGRAAPLVRICDVFAWQDSTPGFGESRRWRPGDRNGEE